jgi:hypothetical protein
MTVHRGAFNLAEFEAGTGLAYYHQSSTVFACGGVRQSNGGDHALRHGQRRLRGIEGC